MRRKGFAVLFLLLEIVITILPLVSADFKVGNKSDVNANYRVNDFIQGRLNISFANESSTSEFTTSFSGVAGRKIKLLDFLQLNKNVNFNCFPLDCSDDYKISGTSETSKSFSLNGEKILGFKLEGNDVKIENEIEFVITSDSRASCNNQLNIDILDNSKIDLGNIKSLSESCNENLKSVCFSAESYDSSRKLDQIPYCEEITLTKSPGFDVKVSMKIDPGTSYDFEEGAPIKASIYNHERELVGECDLEKPATSWEYVRCANNKFIEYLPEESGKKHYICASMKPGANIDGYWVESRISGRKCGFYGDPSQTSTFVADYNIIVESKKFAPVGSFEINETEFQEKTQDSLIAIINNYITDKYNKNCPEEGCIIPFSISGNSQKIDISDIKIKYSSNAGLTQTDKVSFLEKIPAKITSKFIILDLGLANISVPNQKGNFNFSLVLKGEEALKKEISVSEALEEIVRNLHPKTVAAAMPTTFTAFHDIDRDISNYSFEWDFGDGSSKQTSLINKIQYIYNKIGTYTLTIKVKEGNQEISSSQFEVKVESPKNAINETLVNYRKRLTKVEFQIQNLPQSYHSLISSTGLNIETKKSKLGELEDEFAALSSSSETTDELYIDLMKRVFVLSIPKSIEESKTSDVQIVNDINIINLQDINILFSQYYDINLNEEYKSAIFKWAIENVDMRVKHKIYSIFYDGSVDDFVSEFEITLVPKQISEQIAYLIIEKDKNDLIGLQSNYIGAGITGIQFDLSKTNTVKFAIAESIDVFDIPVYIAPTPSILPVTTRGELPKQKSFWWRFSLGSMGVIIIFLIIYIALQEWYKRKYEQHLFKNKNDLINLGYFIKNAKSQNFKNEDIRKKLRKSRWKEEQISYAIKKLEGKRVGMWEIPIFNRYDKKKLEEEIMKRRKMIL